MAKGIDVVITAGGGGTPVTYALSRQINAGGYSVIAPSIAYTGATQTYSDLGPGGTGFADSDDVDYTCTATNADGTSSASAVATLVISGAGAVAITDISTITATGKTLDVSAQTSTLAIYSMTMNPAKTKLWVTGNFQSIFEYNLSVAGDISTGTLFATHDTTLIGGISGASYLTGFKWAPDGSFFTVTAVIIGALYQVPCSTPYDITTAGATKISQPTPSITNGRACVFNPTTGGVMVLGDSNTLRDGVASTANDISTFTTIVNTLDTATATGDTVLNTAEFSHDGSLILMEGALDTLWQIDLSTPFDLTTAGAVTKSKAMGFNTNITITEDKTQLLVINRTAADGIIREYTGS